MSFEHLLIKDVDGERQIGAADLPLRVGTGSDCGLRLPGPGGAPVVLLDLLDGAPFVQPFGRDDSMQINAEPLTTSKRLSDGDVLQFYGSQIIVSATDDRLTLGVRLEDSAYVTAPPELPETAAQAEEEAIDGLHECPPLMYLVRAELAQIDMETQSEPSRASLLEDSLL